MNRIRRIAALVGAIFVLALPEARAICAIEGAPPALMTSADEWIAASPSALRDSLRTTGIAFPTRKVRREKFAPLCDEVTPAVVVFDQNPRVVFDLLIQTERHQEFMDAFGETEPISRAPADHVDRHEVSILFTSLVYHVRHHWDVEASRIWWDLSPAHENDLRGIIGYWELYPLVGGGSVGFYGTAVDVGPMIPKRMQESLTRKNLRSAVGRIREWVVREGGNPR